MSEDVIKDMKVLIVAVCAFAVVVSACIGMYTYKRYENTKAVNYAAEHNYKFYYNGDSVDKEKLDLSAYNAKVNDEDSEVYLSDKHYYRHYTFVPVVP